MMAESSEKDSQDIKIVEEQVYDASNAVKTILGEKFDNNKKYIIAIQGVTTSGKTTLSSCLFNLLNDEKAGLKPFRVSTDHFYKNKPFIGRSEEEIEQYDFDNPKSIDWDAMKKCIKEILDGKDRYSKSSYSFVTKERKEESKINPGFNIIIIEGIFAHGLFQDYFYNLDEFDAFNSEKTIKTPLVENQFIKDLDDKIKVIKIFMNLDKESMRETRERVDKIRSDWSIEKSRDIFERKVYPATLRWVMPNKVNKPDIFINQGSRDVDFCSHLIEDIAKFFGKSTNHNKIKKNMIGLIKETYDQIGVI